MAQCFAQAYLQQAGYNKDKAAAVLAVIQGIGFKVHRQSAHPAYLPLLLSLYLTDKMHAKRNCRCSLWVSND